MITRRRLRIRFVSYFFTIDHGEVAMENGEQLFAERMQEDG